MRQGAERHRGQQNRHHRDGTALPIFSPSPGKERQANQEADDDHRADQQRGVSIAGGRKASNA